jgi:nuclear pore complex protein Nup160
MGKFCLAVYLIRAKVTNHVQLAGSTDTKIDRYLSSGLLDSTEWSLINHGLAKYYSHLVALYEKYKAYSYVVEFARLSIQFFDSSSSNDNLLKTDMLSRLFNAAVATAQFQLAHMTLTSLKDDALKHSSLRKLVSKMCETNHNNDLIKLPFPGMQRDVDEILAQKCKSIMDVINGFPYHQILYSWRIRHGNFRGAASILLDRIQKLRLAGEGDKIDGDDVLDTPVTRQYILLINALSCVDTKQAWIYDEGVPGSEAKGDGEAKRKVVSLADIRKQYQAELDRITAIQNNQFGFKADDVMDLS